MWSLLRDGMKIPARRYATIASGKSSLRGKKGPPLTLEHVGTPSDAILFMRLRFIVWLFCLTKRRSLSNEAARWRCGGISSGRRIVRFPRLLLDVDRRSPFSDGIFRYAEVPPSSTRTELLDFARAEFERHRHVNDIVSWVIDALLLTVGR